MLIDWFTVGAQILNFLILVWLMKRFLYKPVLDAIDAREKVIAAQMADAATKKAEAKKERDDFERKSADFDVQRAALFSKATDEANLKGRQLSDAARQAAADLSAKRQQALQSETLNLSKTLARRTQDEVFAIARKALGDLASESLEDRICEVFARRLRELDGAAQADLGAALKATPSNGLVRSAFNLGQSQRDSVQKALNETFSAEIPLRFETAPDLVSGIELSSQGQKISWSIADYLATLENEVNDLLQVKATAIATTSPAEAKSP